jgi:hypothetical protein
MLDYFLVTMTINSIVGRLGKLCIACSDSAASLINEHPTTLKTTLLALAIIGMGMASLSVIAPTLGIGLAIGSVSAAALSLSYLFKVTLFPNSISDCSLKTTTPDRSQLINKAVTEAYEAIKGMTNDSALRHLACVAAKLAADSVDLRSDQASLRVKMKETAIQVARSVIEGSRVSLPMRPGITDQEAVRIAVSMTKEVAALRIQRWFIRYFYRKFEKAEDSTSHMKVELPIMQEIRKGTILEHQRGDFDRLFYRYVNYAKKVGDIESLQKLSFAFFSAFKNAPCHATWRGEEDEINVLLAHFFAGDFKGTTLANRRSIASAIASLMILLKEFAKLRLEDACKTQEPIWIENTRFANFSNPKGKKFNSPDMPTSSDGLAEIKEFKSWADQALEETDIHFEHGGGEFFLQEFLEGTADGYPLEGGLNNGYGIQVSPYPDLVTDRSEFYAWRGASKSFDNPAILTGTIKAKWLQDCVNSDYEAGLRGEFRQHLSDVNVTPRPDLRYQDAAMDVFRFKHLIKKGCEARYFARYGKDNLCARLAHLVEPFECEKVKSSWFFL